MKNKRSKWGTLKQYKEVCAQIWEERGRMCQKCLTPIYEPKYHNFNHTEGRTINFLNKATIELICFTCHAKHHGINEKNGKWLN